MEIEDEFIQEGLELLASAEEALLDIEKGSDLAENYKIVFRSFHSLKGGAGMMGMEDLQRHMHLLEDFYSTLQGKGKDLSLHSDYFLSGIDHAKLLLNGEIGKFAYYQEESKQSADKSLIVLQEYLKAERLKIAHLGDGKISDDNALSAFEYTKENDIKKFYEQKLWQGYDAIFTVDKKVLEYIRSHHIHLPFFYESNDFNNHFHNGYNLTQLSVELTINLLSISSRFMRSIKSFEKSLQIIMYQFVDLEEFLIQENRESVLQTLKREIFKLLQEKQILTGISR